MHKKAFTLAEVLITLVIIGVIAALTIPNLMQSWTKQALKSELKKAYSEINNVSQKFTSDHAQTMYEYCPKSDSGSIRIYFLPSEIAPYMKLTEYTTGIANLDTKAKLIKENAQTLNNKKAIKYTYFDDGYLKDNRGREWFLEHGGTGFAYISVDLNGIKKGPNRWGYDIFTFQLTSKNQQITPMKSASNYCSYTSNLDNNGLGCSYYALYDISPTDSNKTYWEDFLK